MLPLPSSLAGDALDYVQDEDLCMQSDQKGKILFQKYRVSKYVHLPLLVTFCDT